MAIFKASRRVVLGLTAVVVLGIASVALFIGYCAYTLPLSHPLTSEVAPAASGPYAHG